MKRTDYLLTLASGLLTVSEEKLPDALLYFGNRLELANLAQPGTVSVGGRNTHGQQSNFIQWMDGLRRENIRTVRVITGTSQTGLPDHVAAAFVGGHEWRLQVTTSAAVRTYQLQTRLSRQNAITPVQFIELIHAQSQPEKLWRRIAELIQKANALNDRPFIELNEMEAYLATSAGANVFDGIGSQLMNELQIECELLGTPLYIPSHLQSLFYKSSFSFGIAGNDFYLVCLYAEKEVSPAQVMALLHAQPSLGEVQQQCRKLSKEYSPIATSVFELDIQAWETAISQLPATDFNTVASIVYQSIREVCQHARTQPVIPESLKGYFGPDETEARRIQVRQQIDDAQWFLESNKQPWELYFFEPVNYPSVPVYQNRQATRMAFTRSLQETARFAESVQSPFAEAFRLSDYLISEKLPDGIWDQTHLETLLSELQQHGFSDQARANFEQIFWYGDEMQKIDWTSERICGLFAVSIADVFGGMGSWNDISFEQENEQQTYQRLSTELFTSRQNYFASLVSGGSLFA